MVFITLLFYKQAFSCHLFWLLHAHQLDQSRDDVCQAAALTQLVLRICSLQG